MNIKDFLKKRLSLTNEKAGKLIVVRSGGWVKDQHNPTVYPGGVGAPPFEEFNPSFDATVQSFYVEYCFTDDPTTRREDAHYSEAMP